MLVEDLRPLRHLIRPDQQKDKVEYKEALKILQRFLKIHDSTHDFYKNITNLLLFPGQRVKCVKIQFNGRALAFTNFFGLKQNTQMRIRTTS